MNKQDPPELYRHECRAIREELSAWHDGELADTRQIDAHLTACADCRNFVRRMSDISMVMRQLPQPELGASHLEVLIPQASHRPPWWWSAGSAVLTAAAVIVIAAAWVWWVRGPASGQPVPAQAGTPRIEEDRYADALLAENASDPAAYFAENVQEPEELSADDLVLALSASVWFEEAAREYESEIDVEELVQSLDETEKTEFRRLLGAYGNPEDAHI